MSISYDMDTEGAAKAGTSNYLNETGKYIGSFVSAVSVLSDKKTEGIEFSFKTSDGRTANFLQLWAFNTEGRKLYGHAVLSAIMAVLRVKNIQSKTMTLGDENVEGFPDLCNKPIGLLLQREEYVKRDKSMGFKFNIVAPFDAQSEKVAVELMKNLPAEKLAVMVSQLKDKPAQQRREPAQSGGTSTAAGNWTNDDEIPW